VRLGEGVEGAAPRRRTVWVAETRSSMVKPSCTSSRPWAALRCVCACVCLCVRARTCMHVCVNSAEAAVLWVPQATGPYQAVALSAGATPKPHQSTRRGFFPPIHPGVPLGVRDVAGLAGGKGRGGRVGGPVRVEWGGPRRGAGRPRGRCRGPNQPAGAADHSPGGGRGASFAQRLPPLWRLRRAARPRPFPAPFPAPFPRGGRPP
jgi:hypothetical protein